MQIMDTDDFFERLPQDWNYGVTIDGRVFFVDERNECTTWIHPLTGRSVQSGYIAFPDLPVGWELGYNEENYPYFVNHQEQISTFHNPISGQAIGISAQQQQQQQQQQQHQRGREGPSTAASQDTQRPQGKNKKVNRSESAPVRDLSITPSLKGYLLVRENSTFKTWKKRYCVLADCCLFLYKDASEGDLVRAVAILGYQVAVCQRTDSKSPFTIKVQHPQLKPVHLCAETEEERNMWLEGLTLASQGQRSTPGVRDSLAGVLPLPLDRLGSQRSSIASSRQLGSGRSSLSMQGGHTPQRFPSPRDPRPNNGISQEPSDPSYQRQPNAASYPREQSNRSYPMEPSTGLYPRQPSPASYPREQSNRLYPMEPSTGLYPRQYNAASYPREQNNTAYPSETSTGLYPRQPSAASYPKEQNNPTYTREPRTALYPRQPNNASYPSEQNNSSYPRKPNTALYPQQPNNASYPKEQNNPSYPSQPNSGTFPRQLIGPSYRRGIGTNHVTISAAADKPVPHWTPARNNDLTSRSNHQNHLVTSSPDRSRTHSPTHGQPVQYGPAEPVLYDGFSPGGQHAERPIDVPGHVHRGAPVGQMTPLIIDTSPTVAVESGNSTPLLQANVKEFPQVVEELAGTSTPVTRRDMMMSAQITLAKTKQSALVFQYPEPVSTVSADLGIGRLILKDTENYSKTSKKTPSEGGRQSPVGAEVKTAAQHMREARLQSGASYSHQLEQREMQRLSKYIKHGPKPEHSATETKHNGQAYTQQHQQVQQQDSYLHQTQSQGYQEQRHDYKQQQQSYLQKTHDYLEKPHDYLEKPQGFLLQQPCDYLEQPLDYVEEQCDYLEQSQDYPEPHDYLEQQQDFIEQPHDFKQPPHDYPVQHGYEEPHDYQETPRDIQEKPRDYQEKPHDYQEKPIDYQQPSDYEEQYDYEEQPNDYLEQPWDYPEQPRGYLEPLDGYVASWGMNGVSDGGGVYPPTLSAYTSSSRPLSYAGRQQAPAPSDRHRPQSFAGRSDLSTLEKLDRENALSASSLGQLQLQDLEDEETSLLNKALYTQDIHRKSVGTAQATSPRLPAYHNTHTASKVQDMWAIKEDEDMAEEQVATSRKLKRLQQGLDAHRLRLSVSVSDLIGKSHEELILLLIQLRRTKAQLEARLSQLQGVNAAKDRGEVERQLEVQRPLVSLVDNLVLMGSLYGGDKLRYAAEYKKEALGPGIKLPPPKEMVEFSRRQQEERLIAQDVSRGEELGVAELQTALQKLYELDRSLYQLSAQLTSLQEQKVQLDRALEETRRSGGDSLQEERLHHERSAIQHALAAASTQMEQIAVENARLEQEVVSRQRKNPPAQTNSAQVRARVERELAKVNTVLTGLSQQGHALRQTIELHTGRTKTLRNVKKRETERRSRTTRTEQEFEDQKVRPRSQSLPRTDRRTFETLMKQQFPRRTLDPERRKSATERLFGSGTSLSTSSQTNVSQLAKLVTPRPFGSTGSFRPVRVNSQPSLQANSVPSTLPRREAPDSHLSSLPRREPPRKMPKAGGQWKARDSPRRMTISGTQPSPTELGLTQRSSSMQELVFDQDTITKEVLMIPPQVLIPERYLPEDENLTEEEKLLREERAGKLRRLIAAHSLQDWQPQEINNTEGDVHRNVVVEKHKREQLLSLRHTLARQVTEKSRTVAERHYQAKTPDTYVPTRSAFL